MTSFSNLPRLVKGGIVEIDAETSAVRRVIALQYNPERVSRTLQVQGVGDSGPRSEALRLRGPAVETLRIDAEIDATDQLEFPDQNPVAAQFGIFPQLAALETMVYPTSGQLERNNALAAAGTLEIAPMEVPLTLFIWSRSRILPVRITTSTCLSAARSVPRTAASSAAHAATSCATTPTWRSASSSTRQTAAFGSGGQRHNDMVTIEQLLLSACLAYHQERKGSTFANISIATLFADWGAVSEADARGFTHLVSGAKHDPEITEALERIVAADYPDQYSRCLALLDSLQEAATPVS